LQLQHEHEEEAGNSRVGEQRDQVDAGELPHTKERQWQQRPRRAALDRNKAGERGHTERARRDDGRMAKARARPGHQGRHRARQA
jgi:hypothetical protein